MTKYLVLYRSSMAAGDQIAVGTPEEVQAGMEAWMTWAQKAATALVDLGSPVSRVTTVGENVDAPDSLSVGGFSILQAESVDALAPLLKDHPHLQAPDASIEVLEFLPIPGSG